MFVSLVEPQDQGDPVETLAILVNKWDDGTRGSIIVLHPTGGQSVMHNVPLEGQQFEGGVHIKLSPPAELTPGTPGTDTEPPDPTGGVPDDSYTVGS